MSLNKVFLMGNLTRDPELRQAGTSQVAEFCVAVNGGKETLFADVRAWGKVAEVCDKYLAKGSPVLIEGRLQLNTWQKDGRQCSRMWVVADNVQLLGRREQQPPAPDREYSRYSADDRPPPRRPQAAPDDGENTPF